MTSEDSMSNYTYPAGDRFVVGQVLDAGAVNKLPVGAVVILDRGRLDHNVLIKRFDGIGWVSLYDDRVNVYPDIIGVDGWRLAHLPTWDARPVSVGDTIERHDEFGRLPIGTVALDVGEEYPQSAPAVKVDDHAWLYHHYVDGPEVLDDMDIADCGPHKVIHLPDADGTAGSAAA